MQQLTEVLDHEIDRLDTVLLRVTTLRLLMAAGKHQMVPQTLVELEESVAALESSAVTARRALHHLGFASFAEATIDLDVTDRVDVERRLAQVTALHRDVRTALASVGATAEKAMRAAADHLPEVEAAAAAPSRRHPFLTEA